MHEILFPKSKGEDLHRNRKAPQRAVSKKKQGLKVKRCFGKLSMTREQKGR
jgi:hypothetical protein